MEVGSDSLKSLVASWIRGWDSKIGEQPQGITFRPGRLGIGAVAKPDSSNGSLATTIARNLRQQSRRKKVEVDTNYKIDDDYVEDDDSRYSAVAALRGGSRAASVSATDERHDRKRRKRRKKKGHVENGVRHTSDQIVQSWRDQARTECSEKEMRLHSKVVVDVGEERQARGHDVVNDSRSAACSGTQRVFTDCKMLTWNQRQAYCCLALSIRHPLRWRCVQCRKIKMGCLAHRLFPACLY